MSRDVVLAVCNVSKKFCRSLRRGMYYAAKDVAREVVGLAPSFELRTGEFWSVRDVSVELRRGECLGLIGANGAGKSTLLKLINGIFRPDRGEIRVAGRTGALIEVGAGFHPMLSGRENVYVNAAILGMGKREVDRKLDAIVEFSGIEPTALDAPVRSYSSGMYVRLGFSVAVHCDVDLLLIDEVLAVGDMNFQAKCLNAIGRLRTAGASVILVSHALNHVAGWADRVLVLEHGRVLTLGPPEDAIQRYASYMASQSGDGQPFARTKHGSGRARISDVRVTSHGRMVETVSAGQPVSVSIDLSTTEEIGGVELDLKVFGANDRLVSGGSTRYFLGEIVLRPGRTTVTANYPPVPLNSGVFRPAAGLWARGRSELLDWVECPPLPIVGRAATEGELWWFPEYSIAQEQAVPAESDVT